MAQRAGWFPRRFACLPGLRLGLDEAGALVRVRRRAPRARPRCVCTRRPEARRHSLAGREETPVAPRVARATPRPLRHQRGMGFYRGGDDAMVFQWA